VSKHGLLEPEIYWILEADSYWLLKLECYLQQLTDVYCFWSHIVTCLWNNIRTGLRDQLLAAGTNFLLTDSYLLLETVTRFWNHLLSSGSNLLVLESHLFWKHPHLEPVTRFCDQFPASGKLPLLETPLSGNSYPLLEQLLASVTSFLLTVSFLFLERFICFWIQFPASGKLPYSGHSRSWNQLLASGTSFHLAESYLLLDTITRF
jgi:hypothetical protein